MSERNKPPGSRFVQIGRDADGNIIVTGDANRVFVFPGVNELSRELLERIEHGELRPDETPGALPLPALTLRIESDSHEAGQWRVIPLAAAEEGKPRTVVPPWQVVPRFAEALAGFWELTRRALANEAEWEAIHGDAHDLGEALTGVLTATEREMLIAQAHYEGPPPLLVVESAEDLILALPWELLRLQDEYVVQQGSLASAASHPRRACISPATGDRAS